MDTITKEQWIEAYEITLKEYQNNTHKCTSNVCSKCILGHIIGEHCNCPEDVFITQIMKGCLARIIRATSHPTDNHKEALIAYHKEAIKYLKQIKRFSMDNFQKKLLKLDVQIAKRYKLI